MYSRNLRAVALVALVVLIVSTAASAAALAPRDIVTGGGWAKKSDRRPSPIAARRDELKRRAMEAKLKGKVEGGSYEVEDGTFVQLALEGTDNVWTVPGEFSDYPHNSIPQPDRTVDNTTIWEPDFSEAYFDSLLFADSGNSMRNYFLEQSSGRYTVDGDVTAWVQVPGAAASYDDGDPGPGSATNVWQFLEDSVDGWYTQQTLAGKTGSEIAAYLASFDVWDRYDFDGDDDFNEPDGYIDHFQSLHSGEGNEAGGGELGDNAIWSHSWYARYNLQGQAGPAFNQLGGIQIGDSDYWIGDYTIQPENGGVGVFVHEFTHDLGVPDLYDTNAGENGTGFWTLMSSGSWLSDNPNDIGSKPNHLGPWEKLQLGWLDYAEAASGTTAEMTLGPVEYNSTQPQALYVQLPDKSVSTNIGVPYAGSWMYYSGTGDNKSNLMYKAVTLPGGASLTAKVFYQIELDWDYAYVVVSTDGGATWQSVPTNLSTTTNPNAQNFGYGITGSTRRWKALTADLSAYSGDVLVGFRYWTDGAYSETGLLVDDVAIAGGAVDGAEADGGWTYQGFKRSTGTEAAEYFNYYLAEYRQYWGYDATLQTGPYNFGFLKGKGAAVNKAERFPYADGLLVWYCDTSRTDNNTSQHPGSGIALPVDSHPAPLLRGNVVWRNRIQAYDAPFALDATDAITLNYNCKPTYLPSLAAIPAFDDAHSYWSAANPTGSVKTPATGTVIEVLATKVAADGGSYMGVRVTAPALP